MFFCVFLSLTLKKTKKEIYDVKEMIVIYLSTIFGSK